MSIVWLLACVNGSPKVQCYNDAQCNGRCVDNVCVLASCQSSAECALQEYCLEGDCLPGCQVESDCFAGEECLAGVCQDTSCRNAQLDCGYGENCVDGQCIASDFPLCQPCGYEDWQNTPNGSQECILYNFTPVADCEWQTSSECPNDASCYPTDGLGLVDDGFCLTSYFFQPCESSIDCPRPFVCKEDVYGDETMVNVCWTECPFWRAQGVF